MLGLFFLATDPSVPASADVATDAPAYVAVIVDDPARRKPMQDFDCVQDVYVFFTWYRLKGVHQLTALWFNPKEQEEDRIDLKFIASAEKTENWVALKLLNLKKERNPLLSGTALSRFAGTWETRIYLDGNFLEKKTFSVRCD